MRAKKSLGQHFLMHAATARRIVEVSGVGKDDTVLEIGPGTGLLTKPLLKQARHVIAVEADRELAAQLSETFSPEIANGKLELVEKDIRAFDPASITAPYALVANIPYYITGEIIRTFLSTKHKPQSMTLLVQKEVAERIARAKKGSLLSIAVKAYGDPAYEFTVPRGAFKPAPNVDSAVISIRHITDPFAGRAEESRFFEVLRAGFAHKRKLLAGNLSVVAKSDLVLAAMNAAKLPLKSRAEDLSVADWHRVAKALN